MFLLSVFFYDTMPFDLARGEYIDQAGGSQAPAAVR